LTEERLLEWAMPLQESNQSVLLSRANLHSFQMQSANDAENVLAALSKACGGREKSDFLTFKPSHPLSDTILRRLIRKRISTPSESKHSCGF